MNQDKLMTTELFEKLLSNGEGYLIDFKRDQYLFYKADLLSNGITDKKNIDDERSEILKDILAFANTEKNSDAFILIGLKNGSFFNVSKHFDDAVLHEFINEKTNIRVKFEYKPFDYKGNSVGIIHIYKEQDGLIYAKKDFGIVRENVVYYRDGSSTKTLTPNEIAERQKRGDYLKQFQPIFALGEGSHGINSSFWFLNIKNINETVKNVLIHGSMHNNQKQGAWENGQSFRVDLVDYSENPEIIFYIDYQDKLDNKFRQTLSYTKGKHLQSIKTEEIL